MPLQVTVFGAGAFGGWTALHLLRAGARVTLVDAWGPGNSRSSSGDETRVLRGSYGPNAVYTEMVARAIPLWRENEQRWGLRLFHPTGALWMAGGNDAYEKASARNLEAAGLPFEALDHSECRRRFPQMNWTGLEWAIHEKEAGYVLARRACQAVVEGFATEGGRYEQGLGHPVDLDTWKADQYVFACGPWLPELFPEQLTGRLTPTRQEIFYFGTPAGDTRFEQDEFPAWVDNSAVRYYGIPGNQWRGFKIAEDRPGKRIDPTASDRTVSPGELAKIRQYLSMRFPALRDAPLIESRVCQYEMSADGGLIVDRLPGSDHIWIAGGGSGHGFKFSPALGEHVSKLVLGEESVNPKFALSRFEKAEAGIGERK
ncbi:MAG: FAD-dependent oxidoreductase [Bryobacteraceae bacterium]